MIRHSVAGGVLLPAEADLLAEFGSAGAVLAWQEDFPQGSGVLEEALTTTRS